MTTRVAVLTPPGSAAIAVVEVRGPAAWAVVAPRFRPNRGTLPDTLPVGRFWFGRFGNGAGDEIILSAVAPDAVELHCHGGRVVVDWVVEQLVAAGATHVSWTDPARRAGSWLTQLAEEQLTLAPTVRTAGILLDQYYGAFERELQAILLAADADARLDALCRRGDLGRHLVAPWRVVLAGAPNVGKSSLMNALAGFPRSIVTPTPGTTRDVVQLLLAADGWPVAVSDTAGVRDTPDALEAAGIDLALAEMRAADLVLWLLDGTAPPVLPPEPLPNLWLVVNKCDQPAAWAGVPDAPRVAAATGHGVADLLAAVARSLVPAAPQPGQPLPFTPALADAIAAAWSSRQIATARQAVAALLAGPLT